MYNLFLKIVSVYDAYIQGLTSNTTVSLFDIYLHNLINST